MKSIKRLVFLALLITLATFSLQAQRANTGTKRSGLTTTGLANKTIAPSLTYKTPTATPDSQKGINNTFTGYSAVDWDKIDVRCKNLVGQALATYCLENECSESSNTYIISQSLPLDRTIATLNEYTFDSPSTSVSSTNIGGIYVYNSSTVAMCQPYIVNIVEAYLPANYKIVTDACKDQYASAIDIYCLKNKGCYKMKNFQILEYMKATNTQDYTSSITNTAVAGGTKYFFSDYCMNKLADKVRLSLIDLYMPDYKEWQKGICRRAYQNAMSEYCETEGCMDDLSLIMMLNNEEFNSLVKITNEGIDCNKELTVDVKNTLIEEMVALENRCIREGGVYNASKNQCQWNVVLRDDSNKEIDRIVFNENQTVYCNETMFIDPFSKKGRERADKGWLATEEAAKIIATGTSGIAGGIIGYNVGKNIDNNIWLQNTIEEAVLKGWDSSTNSNASLSQSSNGWNLTDYDDNGVMVKISYNSNEISESNRRRSSNTKMFTKNQLSKIKSTLKRDNINFYQMVEQVEKDLWGSNICKKSPSCSATILVRNVYQVQSKTLTSISFKSGDSADDKKMYSTTATVNYAGVKKTDTVSFKTTTQYKENEISHIDAVEQDWVNFITALEKKQPTAAKELRTIKKIAEAQILPTDKDFSINVSKKTAISISEIDYYKNAIENQTTTIDGVQTSNVYINFNELMIPITDFTADREFAHGATAGKIIGTTVGAAVLGGTAYGITQIVYNSKYKKAGCYTTFSPRNGTRNERKERKIAEWNKSYTFPKILNPM